VTAIGRSTSLRAGLGSKSRRADRILGFPSMAFRLTLAALRRTRARTSRLGIAIIERRPMDASPRERFRRSGGKAAAAEFSSGATRQ